MNYIMIGPCGSTISLPATINKRQPAVVDNVWVVYCNALPVAYLSIVEWERILLWTVDSCRFPRDIETSDMVQGGTTPD